MFMTTSLFINIVVCLKGNSFIVEYTLSGVRISVLWSDRAYIMKDIEDIFSALLSPNILSMALIALLLILITKRTSN
jgi:uncharacterized membrane protein